VEDHWHAISVAAAGIRADLRRVRLHLASAKMGGQRRVRSISMISVASRRNIDGGELTREIQSASAANQSADIFRHCPKCGVDQFTQRALRGELPE
jgi:hypothetical protein